MAAKLSSSERGLLSFLLNAKERANEDLALGYFRDLFGARFTRQGDASRSDGYVAGGFVLELKSKSTDWLAGLCQGLAYQNLSLDFAHVVVAADRTLLVWRVDELPHDLREAVLETQGSPSRIGREIARIFTARRTEIRAAAIWDAKSLFDPLFCGQDELVSDQLRQFAQVLLTGEKKRLPIRPRDLRGVLRDLRPFFDPSQPLKAVRAFYAMLYGWTPSATVALSERAEDTVTVGGETVSGLLPARRIAFKDYVESRYVVSDTPGALDEFFAAYDVAVDAVDPEYRRKHGMYFTDLNLSRFVMWLARDHVPNLGQDYLVIDPACGSGNLVTNWRSPLDLRHKVVSEIDPELLFAVEKRLKSDAWHQGRFTVVPQVSEGRGLNFLDRTAEQYLGEISAALEAKGLSADKPLAFLCNPPYRGDDDQAAGAAGYAIDPTIIAMTGADAERERYCCFLAQMKRVCEVAAESGLPGESLLLLFTKSAWLTRRAIFSSIRQEILSSFEEVDGLLLNGAEFFDIKGQWPVAFTIWRYKGSAAGLNADRAIPLRDLTHLRRRDLESIPWADAVTANEVCHDLMGQAIGKVALGDVRQSLRDWTGQTMTDFKRDRRNAEKGKVEGVGGLPTGDRRRINKKTYGAVDGDHIGFMDDLTPCRVARGRADRPWFRLNSQFMDVKKNRCFSGPPSHLGFCASDLTSAKPLFFWYSLARTFLQAPYPMWADAEDLWAPRLNPATEDLAFASAMAIAFGENECVDTYFPAHNPVVGLRELHASNPMTPLAKFSFWSTTLSPYVQEHGSRPALDLVKAVNALFNSWKSRFDRRSEIAVDYDAPYHVDSRPLTISAGLPQIRDYAQNVQDSELLGHLEAIRISLKAARAAFDDLLRSPVHVAYFHGDDSVTNNVHSPSDLLPNLPERTAFEKSLARRLALAAHIVDRSGNDPALGRTKLVKIFYLADQRATLDLRMSWMREAAGPLDARAVYHQEVGFEALAARADLFSGREVGGKVRYSAGAALQASRAWIHRQLGLQKGEVDRIVALLSPLDTDQCEILATLYACWNDLLLKGRSIEDDKIISDFRESWHARKARFSRARLVKALDWMRANGLTPSGRGTRTRERTIAADQFLQ